MADGTAFTGERQLTSALVDADPAGDSGDIPAGEASGDSDAATSGHGDGDPDGDGDGADAGTED